MTVPRRPRSLLTAVVVVALLAALCASGAAAVITAAPARAETANPPVTVTATANGHTYSLGQAITGLADGDHVDVHVDAQSPPNPTASQIYGIEGRECSLANPINNLFDYTPTQGGNCANVALGSGDLHPSVVVAPPNAVGDMEFWVGEGTTTFQDENLVSHTITCDTTHECRLVVRLAVPSADDYVSFPIVFGAGAAPGAPTGVSAVAGDSQATVSWVAPSSDGGTPITAYTVTSSPGSKTCAWTTGPLSCVVSGLTDGTAYTFTVTATNAVGTGPASSPSSPVTPTAPVTGSYFHALAPTRLVDSRPATQVGPYATPWGAGASRDVTVGGQGGVPATATAVVLNVTVADTTASGFLTVWPKGDTRPTASNLNWTPGEVTANAVTVKLGTSGEVSVYNLAGTTDVIIDVAGYYDSSAAGDGFTSLAPVRLLDSRPASQVGSFNTPWGAGTTRTFGVGGLDGVPSDADAVVFNVTVADTSASGFLTVYPAGGTRPTASSLNWTPGEVIPNAVTVRLGTSGQVSVYNLTGATDVIIDIAGYYQHGTGKLFHPLTPARVLDSRAASQVGAYATPWGPGATRDVAVGGLGGVAGSADSVVLNVTVADATAASFLTVYPKGSSRPTASSLNWTPGEVIPNAVTVKLGTGGDLDAYNLVGNVDVIIDVAGYFG